MKRAATPILFCVFFAGMAHGSGLSSGWRDLLGKEKEYLKSAIIDRVTIHPQRDANSDERITRRGILVRNKDAVATVLLCHGFLCDKYDIACFRNMFPSGKFNFLTFDFRGHGEETDGQISTLGRDEAYDVIAAARYIRNDPNLKSKPLFVWAFSMGAVAAIEAQAKDNSLFDAMILDSPFDSSENILKRSFDQMRFSVMGYQFDIPGRTVLQKYAFHPYVQSFVQMVLKAMLNWDPKHVRLQAAHTYRGRCCGRCRRG